MELTKTMIVMDDVRSKSETSSVKVETVRCVNSKLLFSPMSLE